MGFLRYRTYNLGKLTWGMSKHPGRTRGSWLYRRKVPWRIRICGTANRMNPWMICMIFRIDACTKSQDNYSESCYWGAFIAPVVQGGENFKWGRRVLFLNELGGSASVSSLWPCRPTKTSTQYFNSRLSYIYRMTANLDMLKEAGNFWGVKGPVAFETRLA